MFVLGDMIKFSSSSYLLKALPTQKLAGWNELGSFLVYQATLQLIFVCNLCAAPCFSHFFSAMFGHLHADSWRNSALLRVVNEAVYYLGENSFGLLIFAGSQSRVASKAFAEGRTQCALPVMLMLSWSHTESIFLPLHCSSSTLPLPLQRNKAFSTDNRDPGMHCGVFCCFPLCFPLCSSVFSQMIVYFSGSFNTLIAAF